MFCPKCKTEILDKVNFCPSCGEKIVQDNLSTTTKNISNVSSQIPEKPKKKNLLSIIIIIIMSVIMYNTFIKTHNYNLGITTNGFRQKFNNTAHELRYEKYVIDEDLKIQREKDGDYIGYKFSDGSKIIGSVNTEKNVIKKVMVSVPINSNNNPSMLDTVVIYDCLISSIDSSLPNKGTDILKEFGLTNTQAKLEWNKKKSITKNGKIYTFVVDSSSMSACLTIENVKDVNK
ncbi:zinc ribbon domain-containing protein [Clostridium kluyveri]|uniref:zinc ribbon domain-containing protein n=1 Tax=Clostridium kluyveri TaxID=1534 RepID=UPI002246D8FE|nr:zinc ribbon domain-containing protein [Clostridium kluyveri]UZQ49302.1 zinc ribbon domain-containing protein [Clostridium kluyveri]